MNLRLDALERHQDDIERQQEEIAADLKIVQTFACLYSFAASNEGLSRRAAAQIYRWDWLLGMSVRLIVSKHTRDKDRNIYHWFFKWPLMLPMRCSHVLTGHLRVLGSWPNRPVLALSSQNVIPNESAIIEAFKNNDLTSICELFARGQARPNDTTPENLTLLRVSFSVSLIEHSHHVELMIKSSLPYEQETLQSSKCSLIMVLTQI
jgi:hypothetical protein